MIFAIKRFETHDGDGIRTTLFFKGCPLRCVWCHNPESFRKDMEISFSSEVCKLCKKCEDFCEANRFEAENHIFLRENCDFCGRCIDSCPAEAFKIYGDNPCAEEIAQELLVDEMFFKGSGGGVTFSGGEPLLQVDLCQEIAKILKRSDINIAIDTCGYVPKQTFEAIMPYTDTFLYDIKAIDPEIHKKCTGKTNELILDNLKFLDRCEKDIEIRIPYVPEYNSGEIKAIAEFLSDIKSVSKIRLLPYHNYADSKYTSLGIKNLSPKKLPSKEEILKAKDILSSICGDRVL